MNPSAHDEKTRSGSLMRRIMGFHLAWVFERGSLGHFARADEDLDTACNLPWRGRGTNYFRVNLIPFRFYLWAGGKRPGIGCWKHSLWDETSGIYVCIFISAYTILRSDFAALYFVLCTLSVWLCLQLRIKVDNESGTEVKNSAKVVSAKWDIGNLAFQCYQYSVRIRTMVWYFKTNIPNFVLLVFISQRLVFNMYVYIYISTYM